MSDIVRQNAQIALTTMTQIARIMDSKIGDICVIRGKKLVGRWDKGHRDMTKMDAF